MTLALFFLYMFNGVAVAAHITRDIKVDFSFVFVYLVTILVAGCISYYINRKS